MAGQYAAVTALVNTFVINADRTVADTAVARLKLLDRSIAAIDKSNAVIADNLKEIAGLLTAYKAREDIKGQIYEITGISDIIRGQTAASETATAQQIKGQYAGLRLKSMQETVALFASELLRIKAQIVCTKYQDQTILVCEYWKLEPVKGKTKSGRAKVGKQLRQYITNGVEILEQTDQPGEEIPITARRVVTFHASQKVKAMVEQRQGGSGGKSRS